MLSFKQKKWSTNPILTFQTQRTVATLNTRKTIEKQRFASAC